MNSYELIARQWIEEIWARGNVSLIDEMHDEAYRHHTRTVDLPADADIEYIKRLASYFRRTVRGSHIQVEDVLTEKDRVMIRWSVGGHDADINVKTCSGIALLTLRDYKITDSWIFTDCKA